MQKSKIIRFPLSQTQRERKNRAIEWGDGEDALPMGQTWASVGLAMDRLGDKIERGECGDVIHELDRISLFCWRVARRLR